VPGECQKALDYACDVYGFILGTNF
jgi:hypothetical protein